MYTHISKQLRSLQPTVAQLQSIRNYAGRIEASNALPSRPLKKIRIGKARPAIYHKFNTHVELSDGSVVFRRSQYPKDEFKLIADQRNNPLWNKSKPNMTLLDAEARGKLNRFKNKFASFEQSGMSESEIEEQNEKELKEKKEAFEGNVAESPENAEDDDFLSLLESSYEEKNLGGRIYQKAKKTRRNRNK